MDIGLKELIKSLQDSDLQQFISITNKYNIFNVLHMEREETKLHSMFLADLLNPIGKHDLGSLPLKLFFENVLKKLNISNVNFDSFKINTETSLGEKDIESLVPKGGRLDILIENETHVISIENKIYANDQAYQLTRYFNSLHSKYSNKKIYLIYLNLTGKDPSEISIRKNKTRIEYLEKDKDFYVISYKQIIKDWLVKIPKHDNNNAFNTVLSQYIDVIKTMIRRFEMLDKIQTFLNTNDKYNNFKSLCFIADYITSIEYRFITNFIKSVEDNIENKDILKSRIEKNDKSNFLIVEYKLNGNKIIFKYLYKNHKLYFGVNGKNIELDGFEYIKESNSDFTQKRKIIFEERNNPEKQHNDKDEIVNEIAYYFNQIINKYMTL